MWAFVNVSFVKGFHEAAIEMELADSLSQCGQNVLNRPCMLMHHGKSQCWAICKMLEK